MVTACEATQLRWGGAGGGEISSSDGARCCMPCSAAVDSYTAVQCGTSRKLLTPALQRKESLNTMDTGDTGDEDTGDQRAFCPACPKNRWPQGTVETSAAMLVCLLVTTACRHSLPA